MSNEWDGVDIDRAATDSRPPWETTLARDRIITDSKTGERWFVHGDTGHCANLTNPRPDPIRKRPGNMKGDTATRGMFDG